MKIEIARLYARQRRDGATTLSGKMGYNGTLRIVPNPDKDADDPKSPDFIAFLEERETDAPSRYNGPQLRAPQSTPARGMPQATQQAAGALPEWIEEGEVLDD
jgi:hypothetical protein